jgi:hypothetical protein
MLYSFGGESMTDLFVLVDKNGNYAQSWSKPNKIPAFRSESAALQNIKHYRGEEIKVVRYVAFTD